MKTGGIHEAVRICDAADQFGVKMHDRLHAGEQGFCQRRRSSGCRSFLRDHGGPGRPSLCRIDPYEGGPVYEGPHIFLKEDNGIGITGVPVKFETI